MARVHTNKLGFYGQGSVEISPGLDGQSGIRRCSITKDKLVKQPVEGVDTLFDVLEYAVRMHGSRDALGWREITRMHEEEKEVTKIVDGKEVVEKKKWKYFELSDYQFHSYTDVKNIVSEIGRGLLELGIAADEVFNVYAQTRSVSCRTALQRR
jgi:long-chain acyl-CoA synthetase